MLHGTRFTWLLLALLIATWVLAGCAVPPVIRQAAQAGAASIFAAGAETGGPADAQLQASADALRTLVATQLQVTPADVAVVAGEAVVWPDACLGAAGPDEMCAQVETPGYKITLAVNGEEYTYHTDVGANWLRLVAGPPVDVGEPVIVWQGIVDNGSCQAAQIGAGGVAFGYCGGPQFPGKFVSPARVEALNEFASRYASFTGATDWGTITFTGVGPQVATPAEQAQIAGWAQRLVMEAASGTPMGGLAWSGPQEMGSDDTSKCATLQLGGGEATVWDCAGSPQTVKLNGTYLSRWLAMQDRFASFVIETPTETLTFEGMGAESGAVWQQALLAWARTQYAELSSGQVSAAGSTVLAWDIGPANDAATSCMHLTVLAWGEAYAELRECGPGGAVQEQMTGWLKDFEMEQLAAWVAEYAPLSTEQGYVAGMQPMGAPVPEVQVVDSWAANVWLRLRGVSTNQTGSPIVSAAGYAVARGACQTEAIKLLHLS